MVSSLFSTWSQSWKLHFSSDQDWTSKPSQALSIIFVGEPSSVGLKMVFENLQEYAGN